MTIDRFGNKFSPGVPYARGAIVGSTADDLSKLKAAWNWIRARMTGKPASEVFIMNGLERGMKIDASDIPLLDDELAPALFDDEIRALGLAQLGGDPGRHDLMLCNRQTAALLVAADVMVKDGDVVVGVSPRYSHPAVVRAIAHGGGRFTDCAGLAAFRETMARLDKVDLVALTRLSVSYEILSEDELQEIVRIARAKGARILIDDAGGARVGPAVFDQTKSLGFGAEIVCTGLDKYGTVGPRLGMVGGDKEIVARMRARAFEMGLEARPMLYPAVVKSLRQYSPARVRELVATTMRVKDALERRLGADRLWVTPVTVQLRAEDILELAMQRGRINGPPCVPYEATAGLAMILLRDHGLLTVHFAGMPPGTSALMIKFVAPETMARFGGPDKMAKAIDDSITKLSQVIADKPAYRELLLGAERHVTTIKPAAQSVA
jgi:L-seryl-tRNA(Ser) seleniumtransferase